MLQKQKQKIGSLDNSRNLPDDLQPGDMFVYLRKKLIILLN